MAIAFYGQKVIRIHDTPMKYHTYAVWHGLLLPSPSTSTFSPSSSLTPFWFTIFKYTHTHARTLKQNKRQCKVIYDNSLATKTANCNQSQKRLRPGQKLI